MMHEEQATVATIGGNMEMRGQDLRDFLATWMGGSLPEARRVGLALRWFGFRHVARMSQEPAEYAGTGRDETGRGGIPTPKHSGRLRGKGAILLEVSHRPARVRFPPLPPSKSKRSQTSVNRVPVRPADSMACLSSSEMMSATRQPQGRKMRASPTFVGSMRRP